MNVQHKVTTVLQTVYALMWKVHFNVHVNQDLQEMAKHVVVGYGVRMLFLTLLNSLLNSTDKYFELVF